MLISCPECNEKVSDKAHVCPHCGFQIDTLMKCPDCGRLVPPETTACPVCGYPFAQRPEHSPVVDTQPEVPAGAQDKPTEPTQVGASVRSPERQCQTDPSAFVVAPNGDVILPPSVTRQQAPPQPISPPTPSPNRRLPRVSWMRKLVVPAIAVLILWFALRPQPLTYHVASIDPSFHISEADVESILQDAAGRWNAALGKTAIRIDAGNGGNAIRFVFDYRQQYQDSIAAIDARYSDLAGTKLAIEQERSSLDWEETQLQQELASLNSDIEYWNRRGGATGETYHSLQTRRKTYTTEAQALAQRGAAFNKKVTAYNTRLSECNSELATARQQFDLAGGSTTEVAVGTYDPNDGSIAVYSYADRQHLRLILMHELGHALGCDHATTQGSIMYPELTSAVGLSNPVPTAQDLALVGGD